MVHLSLNLNILMIVFMPNISEHISEQKQNCCFLHAEKCSMNQVPS